jgi:hypothetical protein
VSDDGSIIVVSGLPRSGTSLMMQMLDAGGVPVLTDELRAPDESNPRGYFELDAVKKLRANNSWLEQARGHAIKVIHLLLRELPVDGRFSYRVIFMRRAMNEVLASQRKMLQRAGKAAADDAVLAKVFEAQLAQVRGWLTAQPSFSVLEVEHGSLLEEPRASAETIAGFLGRELDTERMAAAVDPDLYRERLTNRRRGGETLV